jgi:peroxiredoxin
MDMTMYTLDNVNVLRTGFLAPDFSLPDTGGSIFSLRGSLEGNFICLCFFPAGDGDRIIGFLKDLGQGLPTTASGLTVRIVAISPQKLNHLQRLAGKLKLEFPVLSDIGSRVSRQYYVVDSKSPKPSVYFSAFVIDDEGIIRYRAIEVAGFSKFNPEGLRVEIARLI